MAWRRLKGPKLDRTGTWCVEVLKRGATKTWAIREDGSTDYFEVPYEHWMVAREGESMVAAHGYAKRLEAGGLTVRVVTWEQYQARVAAEHAARTRANRSAAAKDAWKRRKAEAAKKAEAARVAARPKLRLV